MDRIPPVRNFVVPVCFLLIPFSFAREPHSPAVPGVAQSKQSGGPRLVADYGKLPLSFERNEGQTDGRVKFLTRGHGYSLFLTGHEAVIALKKGAARAGGILVGHRRPKLESLGQQASADEVIRLQLAGANPSPRVVGMDELPGKVNYFIGNDPAKWRTNVSTYAKVKYKGVYPGIDLVYYGHQGQLEYDFVVAPGADPCAIRLKFHGSGRVRIDKKGDVSLGADNDAIRFQKPVVYQQIGSEKRAVEGNYVSASNSQIAFQVGRYDHSRPIVIDPMLLYSTYLGGSGVDYAFGIAVDSAGSAYVTGETSSTNFPTAEPPQGSYGGGFDDCFVTKFSPSGSTLVYSTYLGGSADDYCAGIAVDSSGNSYVTGPTTSANFPLLNALQATFAFPGIEDIAFVTKLNPSGSALVYSTYLGGRIATQGSAIAVDSSGNAYVTGSTTAGDFPTTVNALQGQIAGGQNAFVSKLNPGGSALVYSTYLGGSITKRNDAPNDQAFGIAVDSSGNAYVTGGATSYDFPTVNALQGQIAGGQNAFVSKLNPSGSALVYSTYLGGSGGDRAFGIAVDGAGNAYVTGQTSSPNFPTSNAFEGTYEGANNGGAAAPFVTVLNPAGSAMVYSTYLGSVAYGSGTGIAVDVSGDAYVTGYTITPNFPTVNSLQGFGGGAYDAFVSKFNPSGSALVYSTFLGGSGWDTAFGIAVDGGGNAYVTGETLSTDFPTLNALQPTQPSTGSAFVAKISPNTRTATATTLVSSLNPSNFGQSVTFTANVTTQGRGTPTGTVSFTDGNFALGAVPLTNGTASLTVSSLAAGMHTLIASYGGDFQFAPRTSSSLIEVVNQVAGSITLSSNLASSTYGQPITLTAVLSLPYGDLATGAVAFRDGANQLGTVNLTNNTATLSGVLLVPGSHAISATYSGDNNVLGSTVAFTQVVSRAATTTSLVSSVNPVAPDQPVIYTVTVTSQYGGAVTGTVSLRVNQTTTIIPITTGGCQPPQSGAGVAVLTNLYSLPGPHLVTATYSGDSNNLPSVSATLKESVRSGPGDDAN